MKFPAPGQLFRSLRATLRLGAYLTFAFLVAGLLAARVLRADLGEAALAGGHQLAVLADLLGQAETIQFNGERMHHASTYTEQSVATVLDRFETYCATSPNLLGSAMRDLPKELATRFDQHLPRAFRFGVMRTETRGRGIVACFVDDRPVRGLALADRIRRFVRTMRLEEFGKFRHVYAEPASGGQTHVVATWADTALDIRAMFPAEGDAAGTDSPVLPRPPHARRTLAAGAEGLPYGIRIYMSTDRAESVRKFYDEWMAQNRFSPVDGAHNVRGASAYLRDDGYQVFLSIGEKGGRTFATLTEAGRAAGSTITSVQISE